VTYETSANQAVNARRARELRRGKDPGPPHEFGAYLAEADHVPPELERARREQLCLEAQIARFKETMRGVRRHIGR
jgi:hypothetical protein